MSDRRVRAELIGVVLFAALTVVTLVVPDWIEAIRRQATALGV